MNCKERPLNPQLISPLHDLINNTCPTVGDTWCNNNNIVEFVSFILTRHIILYYNMFYIGLIYSNTAHIV